jgi:hypothetical protein
MFDLGGINRPAKVYVRFVSAFLFFFFFLLLFRRIANVCSDSDEDEEAFNRNDSGSEGDESGKSPKNSPKKSTTKSSPKGSPLKRTPKSSKKDEISLEMKEDDDEIKTVYQFKVSLPLSHLQKFRLIEVDGSAIEPIGSGCKVSSFYSFYLFFFERASHSLGEMILHLCDNSGRWPNRGFFSAISSKFSDEPAQQYEQFIQDGGDLGDFLIINLKGMFHFNSLHSMNFLDDLYLCLVIAQSFRKNGFGDPPLSEAHLSQALVKVFRKVHTVMFTTRSRSRYQYWPLIQFIQ